ncbi:hypothetical protein K438DRAFT_1884366 [Mycena galopus ATCC 62051]|nr:hypothetical protein K438DRAFT_1884366 [Mycena galopus ATCC 62051]
MQQNTIRCSLSLAADATPEGQAGKFAGDARAETGVPAVMCCVSMAHDTAECVTTPPEPRRRRCARGTSRKKLPEARKSRNKSSR